MIHFPSIRLHFGGAFAKATNTDLDLAVAKASEQYWMEQALEHDENASEILWKAIRMIGARDDEKKAFLIEMLNGESGGCRSAAVSALGEMGELDALRDRLPVETNKFVIAGIAAHLRTDSKP